MDADDMQMKRSTSDISGSDNSRLSSISYHPDYLLPDSCGITDTSLIGDLDEFKPSPSPSPASRSAKTPTPKKAKTTPTKSSPGGKGGSFTPELKEKVVERIFTVGLRAVNMTELAKEVSHITDSPTEGQNRTKADILKLGLSKTQLSNQLQAGHKGNLRDKVIKSARSV